MAGVALPLGLALLYAFNRATREFFLTRFSSANATMRLDFLSEALPKIEERPLLGFGGGVAPDFAEDLARVHNTYVQQLLNFGLLLGSIAALALIGTAVFFFSRWRTSGVARVVGFTLTAQLVIFAVESSFEGTTLRVLFYLSIGLAASLVRASEAQDLPSSTESEPVVPAMESRRSDLQTFQRPG
jgi:O-antigen ligase